MSLDATISGWMSQLRMAADQYSATAATLARSAAQYAKQFAPANLMPYAADVPRASPGAAAPAPAPPAIDPDRLNLPPHPDLRPIAASVPQLVEPVPRVRYAPVKLQRPPVRPLVAPTAPTALPRESAEPTVPALDDPARPTLTAPPRSWATRPVSISFENADAPAFSRDHGADYRAEYRAGLKIAEPYLEGLRDLDGRIDALTAELERLSGPPDYERYEREKYAQARGDTAFQRRDEVLALDRLTAGSAGLPDGRREFASLDARFKSYRADAAGALAARVARLELELAFLQAARALQSRSLSAALDLLSRALEVVTAGADAGLDAAEGALDAALQVFSLERRKLDAYQKFNAAQKRVLDDRKRLALAQLERLDIAINGERLKGQHDQNALALARETGKLIERKLAMFEERIRFAEYATENRGLALDAHEARLKLHSANVRRKRAEINLREAEIKDDLNDVAAALKAVERYALAADQAAANLKAQQTGLKARAAQNKAALDRYRTARDAYLAQHRMLDGAERLRLQAFFAGKEAEFKARELALRKAELANHAALQEAERQLDADRVVAESSIQRQQLKLARLAETGRIQSGGAAVLAGMAGAAAAGLNTMVASAEKETL